jgi:hypothetical protein
MKEKKLIENLQLLQSVQPDSYTLCEIKNKVDSKVLYNKNYNKRKWFAFTPLTTLIAFTTIIFFIIVVVYLLPNTIENAITTTKIALAPNQYEKAKIAFVNADNQFIIMQKKNFDKQKVISLSQSLALANTQMSGLKLIGEKGKYSSQNCLSLYAQYHKSLEIMKSAISSHKNSPEDTQLLAKIRQYDDQSEKKLHEYSD